MDEAQCCDNAPTPTQSVKALVKPDLKEGLVNRKQRIEQQLADVNAAIDALDKNPELARVLELVGKASRY